MQLQHLVIQAHVIHNIKQFRLIAISLAHDMKTLYARQLDSAGGVPKAAQHEDDHMVGEREESDYDKENVGNDTDYSSFLDSLEHCVLPSHSICISNATMT